MKKERYRQAPSKRKALKRHKYSPNRRLQQDIPEPKYQFQFMKKHYLHLKDGPTIVFGGKEIEESETQKRCNYENY